MSNSNLNKSTLIRLESDPRDLSNMSRQELLQLADAVQALEKKYTYNKASFYFPDKGRYSREHYPAVMALMKAGITSRIRGYVAGNSIGKTLWNALESYFHLSGKYPHWWNGLKYDHPISAWVCSINGEALRDGIQAILFGGTGDEDIGTGVIAREDLFDDNGKLQAWRKSIPANCIAQIKVRHYTEGVFDGWSTCDFKVYEQGWAAFQGPTRDWISFDEEPKDKKVYAECLMRLRPKDGSGKMGSFLATFTPTSGCTDVFLSFVPNRIPPIDGIHPKNPLKYTQMAGWRLGSTENAPHLTEEYKMAMIAEMQETDPDNIEARTTGMAAMGSGRIFPIHESEVVVPRFPVPSYWKKCFGMDPGQKNFAGIWIAQDPDTGVYYIYDEYKTNRHILYLIHAEAFKSRGKWLRGGIDPHEAVKPRDTGETVQSYFETQGLNLVSAIGDRMAWVMKIRAWFDSGQVKIMDNLVNIINEIRTWHYDEKDPNKPARNQDDHEIAAMCYCLIVFDSVAKSQIEHEEEEYPEVSPAFDEGRSDITGY